MGEGVYGRGCGWVRMCMDGVRVCMDEGVYG